jgi:predicted RecA/RadA family phage recombinase
MADVDAGAVVVQGELVAVAKLPIKAGELGALHVTGAFDFTKAFGSSTALAVGANAYWDATARVATADAAAGANKLIGKVIRAAADADIVVRIRLAQ